LLEVASPPTAIATEAKARDVSETPQHADAAATGDRLPGDRRLSSSAGAQPAVEAALLAARLLGWAAQRAPEASAASPIPRQNPPEAPATRSADCGLLALGAPLGAGLVDSTAVHPLP